MHDGGEGSDGAVGVLPAAGDGRSASAAAEPAEEAEFSAGVDPGGGIGGRIGIGIGGGNGIGNGNGIRNGLGLGLGLGLEVTEPFRQVPFEEVEEAPRVPHAWGRVTREDVTSSSVGSRCTRWKRAATASAICSCSHFAHVDAAPRFVEAITPFLATG